MLLLADIHIHALFGVDDGAKTEREMQAMISRSYEDGIRLLCVTPHYHPGYFGDNQSKVDAAFARLSVYIAEQHPDMRLFLGNELRYSRDCISWLAEGQCRTMGGTRYVLVDFSADESEKNITTGLNRLLSAGYIPILAHVERYRKLAYNVNLLQEYRANGIWIQMDSQSVFGGFGVRVQLWSRKILNNRLADIISSDAHDLARRPPGLSEIRQYLQNKYSANYTAALCYQNAHRLLLDMAGEER